jgi:hypothetical protein
MSNVSHKTAEKIKTHILYSRTIFRKSCPLWNDIAKFVRAGQATDDITIRRMRVACWITKATDTHLEYVTLIALPQQQWLREGVSILRCTYNASFVGTEAYINTLNAKLNPICHLLALLGTQHIFHVSLLKVKVVSHCIVRYCTMQFGLWLPTLG